MNVSVLGFGGWEIGYQHISLRTVKKLLNEAVDAGINIIDTADCYATSEELIGEAVGKRRNEFYLLTKCGHESGWSYADWRPESLLRSIQRSLKRLKNRSFGSHPAPQLFGSRTSQGSRHRYPETRSRARLHPLYRLQRRQPDSAIRHRMRRVRYVANIHRPRRSGSTRPLSASGREARYRGHRQTPVANVAWQNGDRPPANTYGRPYWERLQKLKYELLQGRLKRTVANALRLLSAYLAFIQRLSERLSQEDSRKTVRPSRRGLCPRNCSRTFVLAGVRSPNQPG